MNRALSRTFSTRTVHRLANRIDAAGHSSRDTVKCKLLGQNSETYMINVACPCLQPRNTALPPHTSQTRVSPEHAGALQIQPGLRILCGLDLVRTLMQRRLTTSSAAFAHASSAGSFSFSASSGRPAGLASKRLPCRRCVIYVSRHVGHRHVKSFLSRPSHYRGFVNSCVSSELQKGPCHPGAEDGGARANSGIITSITAVRDP
jgi:hypothetical protein